MTATQPADPLLRKALDALIESGALRATDDDGDCLDCGRAHGHRPDCEYEKFRAALGDHATLGLRQAVIDAALAWRNVVKSDDEAFLAEATLFGAVDALHAALREGEKAREPRWTNDEPMCPIHSNAHPIGTCEQRKEDREGRTLP
jgi:hypothetical protein